MNKLFLFDIDHTLLTTISDKRFGQTIKNLHEIDIDSELDIQGLTDYLIFEALLKEQGWDDVQIQKHIADLLSESERVYIESFEPDSVKILPGVKELLEALHDSGVQLGLITGNLELIAKTKLKALNLDKYFGGGGFGSDPHKTRNELVTIAIKRMGFEDRKDDVFVVGDTARDILAAHQAGIKNSVGVANGFRDIKELKDAGAKFVFEDFADTKEVMRQLGILN